MIRFAIVIVPVRKSQSVRRYLYTSRRRSKKKKNKRVLMYINKKKIRRQEDEEERGKKNRMNERTRISYIYKTQIN